MDFNQTETYERYRYSCKVNASLRSTIPVVGCEINPSVSRIWKGHCPVPFHSYSLNYLWYRKKISTDEAAVTDEGGKDWVLVSCSKNFVPEVDDLGLILKLECVVVDLLTNAVLSEPNETITDPVTQPRSMIPISSLCESSCLRSTSLKDFTFSILSYNILSDIYIRLKCHECPPWALEWEYRRHNLLLEIIKYDADIICLQEVQSDHFENFFEPELTEKGYTAIYKKRNNEVYTGSHCVADGCATFYQRHLFKEVEQRGVEFSKETSPVVEALEPDLRNEASKHLMKVVTLVNELEKMLQSEMPLLICGDFNSIPQSDPYNFVISRKLKRRASVDPFGVYRHLKLYHRFLLASAYASFGSAVAKQEGQLRKFNQETREPLFTFFSKQYSKTLDYIFYTVNSLEVVAVLDLLDHEDVTDGLPSPLWSSDHIALMSRFRIKRVIRCPSLPLDEVEFEDPPKNSLAARIVLAGSS